MLPGFSPAEQGIYPQKETVKFQVPFLQVFRGNRAFGKLVNLGGKIHIPMMSQGFPARGRHAAK